MKRRPAGSTGLELTELGFGAAPLGNLYRAVSDDQAAATVAAAWNGGVRYFDTAPHYGLGLSERRLGAALAGRPRDSFVLSTKVGRLLEPNPEPTGTDLGEGSGFDVPDRLRRRFDFSANGVRRSLEASLDRLGLERIDIAFIHDPDDHLDQAVNEAYPALAELRAAGVLRAVGAGMNDPRGLAVLVEHCKLDVVMLAGRFTLVDRSGLPLLQLCRQRGVAVVAAAPFNSGLLAQLVPPDDATFDYQAASRERIDAARLAASVCRRFGAELPQAALQFPLRHPAVASVVAGMRSPVEASENTCRMDHLVAEHVWPALEAIG